ncbi:hypothetical protein CEE37_05230 [candidate division LCP-89 bacterium B3_LCP]|uniref:Uncharacterized protein n=1 Tax=candidate division LCP-89 bacterium B3_LCP TaxID=2012998 RepID=A0A532V1I2_UNCL8|nr:MAG: hypothetical protein CEE37_05230 [candidate division LCP-89 bacterium B3_LCP]
MASMYKLPDASIVNLCIYDISGRLVSELVNGWRGAGVHEVTWDASGFTSGVYFAVMNAGEFKQTKKLLLLK